MPTVPNAFTQEPSQMAQTPKGSKWVTVGDEYYRQAPGPKRQVQTAKQKLQPISRETSVYYASEGEISPRNTGPGSFSGYKVQAGISDVNEIPDANVFPHSPQSWEDEDDWLADHKARRSSSRASDVSDVDEKVVKRDSPVSIAASKIFARDWKTSPSSPRPSTTMTKFPRISVMVPKITKMKNAKKRKTWNWRKPYDPHAEVRKMQARKVGFLARFREIYKAGPYGEGQKFWWQVRRTGKQRKARKRAERQPNQYIKRPDTPAISHPNGTKPKLLPAAEPHTQRRQRSDEVSHSVLMTTSAELPLTVSPMVQFDAETTTRERARVNKTLPASPEAPNPPPKSPLRKAPCLSSPRGPRFVTLGDIQKTKPNKKAKVRKQSHTSIWLAGKSDLLFNRREGNSASKGHSKQNRQQTRPKISRPFNVVTDGLEIYTNGEGGSAGPSAPKVGLPANPKVFKQSEEAPWRPQRPGEAKGKSSHHLRDLWANYQDNSLSKFFNIASNPYRRRSSSESSFACQGIDVSMRDSHYPYLTQAVGQAARGNPGTSSRRRTKSMDNAREGVVPAPLFSGPRSGLEGRQGVSRGVSVKRDTSFYQPYDDFLHEYRG